MNPMSPTIKIRKLTEGDLIPCIRLFQETVHAINAKDYSPEQLNIWAPERINPEDNRWLTLLENIALVAVIDGQIVGFGDITSTGHLDRLYVHKDYQGRQIATALLTELEKQASQKQISEITTEASITAKPFFEVMGYTNIKEQVKDVKGTKFTNFIMKKIIV
jgi:putative acetyltransferase